MPAITLDIGGEDWANGAPTGGLHCSIINRFGIDLAEYGDPVSGPIASL